MKVAKTGDFQRRHLVYKTFIFW